LVNAHLRRRGFNNANQIARPRRQERTVQRLLRPYTAKDKKQTDERQGDHDGQDNRPDEA
jgi:hypothetical protein